MRYASRFPLQISASDFAFNDEAPRESAALVADIERFTRQLFPRSFARTLLLCAAAGAEGANDGGVDGEEAGPEPEPEEAFVDVFVCGLLRVCRLDVRAALMLRLQKEEGLSVGRPVHGTGCRRLFFF